MQDRRLVKKLESKQTRIERILSRETELTEREKEYYGAKMFCYSIAVASQKEGK